VPDSRDRPSSIVEAWRSSSEGKVTTLLEWLYYLCASQVLVTKDISEQGLLAGEEMCSEAAR
jgi:hypothetical protein